MTQHQTAVRPRSMGTAPDYGAVSSTTTNEANARQSRAIEIASPAIPATNNLAIRRSDDVATEREHQSAGDVAGVSRRTVMNAMLKSIPAAVATVAAPSIAMATASDNDDADLIALGKKFETAYAEFVAADNTRDRLMADAFGRAMERSGLGERFLDPKVLSKEEFKVWLEVLGAEQAGIGDMDAELVNMEPIEIAVMNTPAHTLAGLRVKVQVAIFRNRHLWSAPRNKLDWHEEATRELIETACRLTGQSIPVETVSNPAVERAREVLEQIREAAEYGEKRQPIDANRKLLAAYSQWLFYERRLLALEVHGDVDAENVIPCTRVGDYHFPAYDNGPTWQDKPQPSTRAAAIMSAAGVDLDYVLNGPPKSAEAA